MIAGKMNCKLVLLEPLRSVDNMGAETVTYNPARTVWAERVAMQGKRSEEAGEHFSAYETRFNVRIAHPVHENWRVQHLGGYLYTIEAIIPNKPKGFKTLICVRVNE